MEYSMEDLVPVVSLLAEKMTGFESSSITYEKAEQLMGAVLFCIHEPEDNPAAGTAEDRSADIAVSGGKISARKAYELGYGRVMNKVKSAMSLYHKILEGFDSFENVCLYDTFIKGMPEFFKWYDVQFAPQNEILTLDYPILSDISGYEGIDKIEFFLRCLYQEQIFLTGLQRSYVLAVLKEYSRGYRDIIENISEIVLTDVLKHMILQKPLTNEPFTKAEEQTLQEVLESEDWNSVEKTGKKLEGYLQGLVKLQYPGEKDLQEYLTLCLNDITIRMMPGL